MSMGPLGVPSPTGENAIWVAEVERRLKEAEDVASIYATEDALESKVTELQSKLDDLQNQVSETSLIQNGMQVNLTGLEERQNEVNDGGDTGKTKHDKQSMTTRRDFTYLPKYGGKHEEYDD